MNSLKVYKILKKKSFEELNAIGCFKGQEQKMNKNLLKSFFYPYRRKLYLYPHCFVNFVNNLHQNVFRTLVHRPEIYFRKFLVKTELAAETFNKKVKLGFNEI